MRAVNLLPADLRSAVKAPAAVTSTPEDGGGSGAYVALGALGLCALALAGYVLTDNQIKQQQADLDQLTARSAVVTREVAALKPYADFQATAQARIATVHDLASQRFDWEHALREMARAIPSNVTVKKLSGSVSADAGSDSPLRGAITAPAVTIDGCTRDQESVAVLMSRLRTVSGVTRVSLAKSTKADPAQGGAAAAAADSAPADATTVVAGCSGKGEDQPPDFQVVAFFEDDTAATVAAATVTPGAATAPQDAASATKPPSDGAVEAAADGKTASTDKGAE